MEESSPRAGAHDRDLADVPVAVYDRDGDPMGRDQEQLVAHLIWRLKGRVVGRYGDRPGDADRGDPGWWAKLPLPLVAEAARDGLAYRTVDGWEVVIG